MNIRQKIIFSILGVILLMFIALLSVFIFHTRALLEYKQISRNLILENELQSRVYELLEYYNAYIIAPNIAQRKQVYEQTRGDIYTIFFELDAAITNEDSKVRYRGLKQVIGNILDRTDEGIVAVEGGNAARALELYGDVLSKRDFVADNTTSLLLTEIEHLHEIEESLGTQYRHQLILVSTWIFLITCAVIIYALFFARRISQPIGVLSSIAKEVADGSYESRIPENMLAYTDEVGKLARSFNTMLGRLNDKITQVEKANAMVLETQQRLQERNAELERFNKIVVGREIKMVELKRDIAQLESKVKECTVSGDK